MTNSSKPHRTWTWFHPVLAIMMIWHTSEANIGKFFSFFWSLSFFGFLLFLSIIIMYWFMPDCKLFCRDETESDRIMNATGNVVFEDECRFDVCMCT